MWGKFKKSETLGQGEVRQDQLLSIRPHLRQGHMHCELDQTSFISFMTSVMSYRVDEKIQKMAEWWGMVIWSLNMSKHNSKIVKVILKELSISNIVISIGRAHLLYYTLTLPLCVVAPKHHIFTHLSKQANAKHRHQLRSCATLLPSKPSILFQNVLFLIQIGCK